MIKNPTIKTIVNQPVTSNCYVVYKSNHCVVVDPGSEDAGEILGWIERNELVLDYIILTHEHFDHLWSVNELRSNYPDTKLICSGKCSERIQNRKRNFSVFYNGVGFESKRAEVEITKSVETLEWDGETLVFILTPGHSEGSMCFYIESSNALFTGDTLIPGLKTVTKLSGGDADKLKDSFAVLDKMFLHKNPFLYPGHDCGASYLESKEISKK